MRLTTCLLALSTFVALPSQAEEAADCAALRVEVQALREKVAVLEAMTRTPAISMAAQSADAALPGISAKPDAIEKPYSRTGCSKGLFQNSKAARWQDVERWADLEKGLSQAEVEALLGVEHYDENGGGNIIWHYGKCDASSRAQVLFDNGRLMDWRAPSR